MQDEPKPDEILAAVARYLRDVAAPATSGHVSFNLRVAANAIEMSRRQLTSEPPSIPAEAARLRAILGIEGDLAELNAELCRRLAAGEIDLETPGLADHLWAATLAKLAVDQPTYWGYRAALDQRGHSPLLPPLPPLHGEGGPAQPGRVGDATPPPPALRATSPIKGEEEGGPAKPGRVGDATPPPPALRATSPIKGEEEGGPAQPGRVGDATPPPPAPRATSPIQGEEEGTEPPKNT